jgi:hypothetical protein
MVNGTKGSTGSGSISRSCRTACRTTLDNVARRIVEQAAFTLGTPIDELRRTRVIPFAVPAKRQTFVYQEGFDVTELAPAGLLVAEPQHVGTVDFNASFSQFLCLMRQVHPFTPS